MGGLTPAGDTRLQVEVTDVKLHVNAAAIHLLTSISSGLTSAPPRPEDPATTQPAWTELWDTRDVHSFNFWFLQPETADEAMQQDDSVAPAAVATGAARQAHREELIFKMRSLSVTVEQVVGARNVPLVLLDASFEAQVKDWSAKLLVESSLKLELAYYNSLLAAWEPIIECVERRDAGMVSFSPWELHMKVEKNEDHTEITSPLSPASVSSDVAELVNFQPPVLSIHVSTKDPLEVTVTRTCLDVLTDLQESLANALELTAPVADETDAHFLIRNQLDQRVVVLTNGEYTVHGSDIEEVVLDEGAEVPLMARDLASVQRAASSTAAADTKTVRVKVPALDWTADIPVTRAESRFFRVSPRRGDGGDSRGLLADIRAHFDSKIVTIRSCVQVENHQSVPVKVYYMNSGGNELHCVGVAEPHGMLALPLAAVYSNTAEIFFGVEGYTVSVQPFVWRELQNTPEVTRTLKCDSKKGKEGHPFCMLCHGEMKPVFFEASRAKTLTSRSYRIHLRPPAVLSNLLPVEVTYLRPGDLEAVVLPPGGSCQMSTAQAGERVTLQLSSYLDRRWACNHLLEEPTDGRDGLSVWSFISADGDHQADLSLGVHTRSVDGSLQLALYAPFWMVNRTGKMLTYKTVGEASSLIYHPETFTEPVLFSFKPSSFFSKKKASVRVEDSEWSDKFSLDTVGSGGTVTCASHSTDYGVRQRATYCGPSTALSSSPSLLRPMPGPQRQRSARLEPPRPGSGPATRSSSVAFWRRPGSRRHRDLTISVQIQLSRSGLTRQVYFLPSVVVANNAPYDVQIHEAPAEEDWFTIPANSCLPFWPRDKNKELRCRVAGTTEETTYFSYKITNDCLLHLKNKYGGISTSVQVDEASTIITLDDYVDGMATVRLINHTPSDEVAYHQRPFEQRSVLKPGEVRLYTWERPTSERTLSWSCGKVKGRIDPLVKDGIEEFEGKDGTPLYWVSFLDGMQRTLMFTADLAVATQAHNAVELERIDQEITVEIEGVGLSLVNNITQTDVMYLGITSSGVVWETQKAHGKRFRAMTSLQCALLERAHQTYENQRMVGATAPTRQVLDNKMEVDFASMQLLQPNRRYLRRTFQSGVWLQLRTSAHQRQFHAKLNRLQLDNQLRDSVFPVVLAPVPPPKSIAADSVPKAFVEMSVVERLAEHTMVRQYKYCKMLIQEFHVKLDQGFIAALVDVFSVDKLNRNTKELVESDLELAREELEKKVAIRSLQEQRNFFDFLHFSPLKIHVSFSMTGAGGGGGSGNSSGGPPIASGFVQLLLQSVGVTLTEIQDVVFKLAYFQREHQFLSQTELTSEVTAHYTGQAVKQLYVLVLGLDVIGNPFGLVVGLTDGVSDLFYEPVQGAIQGPGEFAEGLALGVTSLFSHAVGGTAGAVSRITGTLGKGIAALTLDQEYQQKRREAMNRRPADFTSGIAQSGRGLFMGVVDGVTGVVRKPIEGAQEEGALGFVKGMGKGMVGLFTRPTSGVVDFASGSFDAVKRTMDQDEVTRLRPARHFQADRIIRPYVRHEAEGAKTLLELEKGRYASTDTYVAHAICRPDRRLVFLLTDRRVLLLTRNEIFGNWQVEWTFMWKELTGPPKVTSKGLELGVPSSKRGFSLFSGSDGVKVVPITDQASAQWMKSKMEDTMRQYNVH
ncbi:vacuolar protein sorting-associated protein 13-like [Amphibalanus amphitrite]|uniref:vacuolar protein sorting-associated protein 13-like n=1 Tax=Amphibalanus amphitrite TaxID=1232801 RepID=UPI001C91E4A7|nr:vacuolar protein sorting-associated protein 13-like [Amphibalanus amphitrite]